MEEKNKSEDLSITNKEDNTSEYITEINEELEEDEDKETKKIRLINQIEVVKSENEKIKDIIDENIEKFNNNRDVIIKYKYSLPDKSGGNTQMGDFTDDYKFEDLYTNPPIHKLNISNNILINKGITEGLFKKDKLEEKTLDQWEENEKIEHVSDFGKQIIETIKNNYKQGDESQQWRENVEFYDIISWFGKDIYWILPENESLEGLKKYTYLFRDKNFKISDKIQIQYDSFSKKFYINIGDYEEYFGIINKCDNLECSIDEDEYEKMIHKLKEKDNIDEVLSELIDIRKKYVFNDVRKLIDMYRMSLLNNDKNPGETSSDYDGGERRDDEGGDSPQAVVSADGMDGRGVDGGGYRNQRGGVIPKDTKYKQIEPGLLIEYIRREQGKILPEDKYLFDPFGKDKLTEELKKHDNKTYNEDANAQENINAEYDHREKYFKSENSERIFPFVTLIYDDDTNLFNGYVEIKEVEDSKRQHTKIFPEEIYIKYDGVIKDEEEKEITKRKLKDYEEFTLLFIFENMSKITSVYDLEKIDEIQKEFLKYLISNSDIPGYDEIKEYSEIHDILNNEWIRFLEKYDMNDRGIFKHIGENRDKRIEQFINNSKSSLIISEKKKLDKVFNIFQKLLKEYENPDSKYMKSNEYIRIEEILGGDNNKVNYILKTFTDICKESSKLDDTYKSLIKNHNEVKTEFEGNIKEIKSIIDKVNLILYYKVAFDDKEEEEDKKKELNDKINESFYIIKSSIERTLLSYKDKLMQKSSEILGGENLDKTNYDDISEIVDKVQLIESAGELNFPPKDSPIDIIIRGSREGSLDDVFKIDGQTNITEQIELGEFSNFKSINEIIEKNHGSLQYERGKIILKRGITEGALATGEALSQAAQATGEALSKTAEVAGDVLERGSEVLADIGERGPEAVTELGEIAKEKISYGLDVGSEKAREGASRIRDASVRTLQKGIDKLIQMADSDISIPELRSQFLDFLKNLTKLDLKLDSDNIITVPREFIYQLSDKLGDKWGQFTDKLGDRMSLLDEGSDTDILNEEELDAERGNSIGGGKKNKRTKKIHRLRRNNQYGGKPISEIRELIEGTEKLQDMKKNSEIQFIGQVGEIEKNSGAIIIEGLDNKEEIDKLSDIMRKYNKAIIIERSKLRESDPGNYRIIDSDKTTPVDPSDPGGTKMSEKRVKDLDKAVDEIDITIPEVEQSQIDELKTKINEFKIKIKIEKNDETSEGKEIELDNIIDKLKDIKINYENIDEGRVSKTKIVGQKGKSDEEYEEGVKKFYRKQPSSKKFLKGAKITEDETIESLKNKQIKKRDGNFVGGMFEGTVNNIPIGTSIQQIKKIEGSIIDGPIVDILQKMYGYNYDTPKPENEGRGKKTEEMIKNMHYTGLKGEITRKVDLKDSLRNLRILISRIRLGKFKKSEEKSEKIKIIKDWMKTYYWDYNIIHYFFHEYIKNKYILPVQIKNDMNLLFTYSMKEVIDVFLKDTNFETSEGGFNTIFKKNFVDIDSNNIRKYEKELNNIDESTAWFGRLRDFRGLNSVDEGARINLEKKLKKEGTIPKKILNYKDLIIPETYFEPAEEGSDKNYFNIFLDLLLNEEYGIIANSINLFGSGKSLYPQKYVQWMGGQKTEGEDVQSEYGYFDIGKKENDARGKMVPLELYKNIINDEYFRVSPSEYKKKKQDDNVLIFFTDKPSDRVKLTGKATEKKRKKRIKDHEREIRNKESSILEIRKQIDDCVRNTEKRKKELDHLNIEKMNMEKRQEILKKEQDEVIFNTVGCAFMYELPQIIMKYITNCIDFNEDGVIIGRTPFFCGIQYKSICDGTFQDKDICDWFSLKIEKGEFPNLNMKGEFGILLIDKLLKMLTKTIPFKKFPKTKFPYFFRCKHPNCNEIATWGLKECCIVCKCQKHAEEENIKINRGNIAKERKNSQIEEKNRIIREENIKLKEEGKKIKSLIETVPFIKDEEFVEIINWGEKKEDININNYIGLYKKEIIEKITKSDFNYNCLHPFFSNLIDFDFNMFNGIFTLPSFKKFSGDITFWKKNKAKTERYKSEKENCDKQFKQLKIYVEKKKKEFEQLIEQFLKLKQNYDELELENKKLQMRVASRASSVHSDSTGGGKNIRKNKRKFKRKKRYIHGGGKSLLDIATKSKKIFEELEIIDFDRPGIEYETVSSNLENLFINIINNFVIGFESDIENYLDKTMKYNYASITDSFISFNLSNSDIKEIELNLIEKDNNKFKGNLKNILKKKNKGQQKIRKYLASINIIPTQKKKSDKFLDKLSDSMNGKFNLITFSNIAYNFKNIIFNSIGDNILNMSIEDLITNCNVVFEKLNNDEIVKIDNISGGDEYGEEIYDELFNNKQLFEGGGSPIIKKGTDDKLIELLNDIKIRDLVNNQYINFDDFVLKITGEYIELNGNYKMKFFNYQKIFNSILLTLLKICSFKIKEIYKNIFRKNILDNSEASEQFSVFIFKFINNVNSKDNKVNISWVPDFQEFIYYYRDYLTNILKTISDTVQGEQEGNYLKEADKKYEILKENLDILGYNKKEKIIMSKNNLTDEQREKLGGETLNLFNEIELPEAYFESGTDQKMFASARGEEIELKRFKPGAVRSQEFKNKLIENEKRNNELVGDSANEFEKTVVKPLTEFVENRLNISDFIKLFTPNMKDKKYLSELIIPSELIQEYLDKKSGKSNADKIQKLNVVWDKLTKHFSIENIVEDQEQSQGTSAGGGKKKIKTLKNKNQMGGVNSYDDDDDDESSRFINMIEKLNLDIDNYTTNNRSITNQINKQIDDNFSGESLNSAGRGFYYGFLLLRLPILPIIWYKLRGKPLPDLKLMTSKFENLFTRDSRKKIKKFTGDTNKIITDLDEVTLINDKNKEKAAIIEISKLYEKKENDKQKSIDKFNTAWKQEIKETVKNMPFEFIIEYVNEEYEDIMRELVIDSRAPVILTDSEKVEDQKKFIKKELSELRVIKEIQFDDDILENIRELRNLIVEEERLIKIEKDRGLSPEEEEKKKEIREGKKKNIGNINSKRTLERIATTEKDKISDEKILEIIEEKEDKISYSDFWEDEQQTKEIPHKLIESTELFPYIGNLSGEWRSKVYNQIRDLDSFGTRYSSNKKVAENVEVIKKIMETPEAKYFKNNKSFIGIKGQQKNLEVVDYVEYKIFTKSLSLLRNLKKNINRIRGNIDSYFDENIDKNVNRDKITVDKGPELKKIISNYMYILVNNEELLKSHYIPFINKIIDDMKEYTTGYIIMDHLLLKEFIIYYANYYSENESLIKELISENNIKIEKDSALTKLTDSLKKSSGLVVKKLKEHDLKHRIFDIKKNHGITINDFIILNINKSILNNLISDLKLDEKETMNLNIVIEEIVKYVKDEIERKNLKKENREKLLEKFKNFKKKKDLKEKSDLTKKKTENLVESLKDKGIDPEKLKLVDEMNRIRDEESQKSEELISKYENELELDNERIDGLIKEKESNENNIGELLKLINKNRQSRAEVSEKARELLVDKLTKLKQKKQVNDNILEELTIKNEKMNLAITKLKKDHSKRLQDLREINNVKQNLAEEKDKIEKMRLRMELTENKLKNKQDRLLSREKTIKRNERDLKKRTHRKKEKLPIDRPSDKKTKKKKRNKVFLLK